MYAAIAACEGARKDLAVLQAAGFDAVMFGNENDRPYEFDVDTASTASMAYVVGALRAEIKVPFGVDVHWDPMSSIALAAATGASFVREIMTGTYASDMGLWNPNAGAALRYRDRLKRSDLAVLFNISAEFASSLDRRSLADRRPRRKPRIDVGATGSIPGLDVIGDLLAGHDGRQHGVGADDARHDRGVDNAQARDADHARPLVDHRLAHCHGKDGR